MNKRKIIALMTAVILFNGFITNNERRAGAVSRGNGFYKNKEYEKAISEYSNAVKIESNRDTGKIYFNLGNSYYRLKKYDDAVAAYEKGDKSFNNYFNLGNAYFKKAEEDNSEKKIEFYQKAAENYKKGIKLNSDNTDIKKNLEYTEKKMEELKDKQDKDKQDKDKQDKDKQDKDKQDKDKQDKDKQDKEQQGKNNKDQKNQEAQAKEQENTKEEMKKQEQEAIMQLLRMNEKEDLQKNKLKYMGGTRSGKDW